MASTSRPLVEGPLSKWTNVVSGWQYRWFVLDQSSGMLSYYTSKEKMTKGSRRGCIALKKAILGIDDEEDSTFTIHVDGRTFHFQVGDVGPPAAQNTEERERWVQALDSTIRRLLQPVKRLELNLPLTKRGLSVEHRLAICESYHSLLVEQLQSLSEAMNTSEEAERIRNTAREMLSALRQCIDLMKEDHVQGIPSFLALSGLTGAVPLLPTEKEDSNDQPPVSSTAEQLDVIVAAGATVGQKDGPETASGEIAEDEEEEEVETATGDEGDSSDDDSDIFVDAVENPSPVVVISPSVSIPAPEGDPPDVEEDTEYNETDNTAGGVAANKSLIMYMLSQVKVGMDLSRVTLPTFILEKRSLLEMYADFLAHPDVFSTITDYPTPKERMVAGIRYFVSSFHSARGTVAKKPYNPILGETFRCYWDLPGGCRTPPTPEAKHIIESGPVPFANHNSVTFIAEQVSHHPPVSGFYAECPSKRMYVNGSIYTKSKFLGLSLGVHNIGTVTLTLMDHNEDYVCTLPNAYARSILTYPWMELGGKCYIRCPQSGYHANVDFHCKPFYGGKKHRVTAELYHESEKKPFLKLDGEWTDVINVKHPNGDEEEFVDVLSLPKIRKKIQKISAQDPGESKHRWVKVTEALAREDVEAATNAKHELEEKQRADARERQAKGEEWQQKLFHQEGDTWIYNTPLPKRLSEHQNPV